MPDEMKSTYSIIASNYTGWLFAWKGTAKEVKKFLGNRVVIGPVQSVNEEQALAAWKA